VTLAQLHLDGSESPPAPVIRKGFCRCGCGERVEGMMEYWPAHRQRAYRRRVKAEMERAGLPASPSLRAAGVTRGTTARNGDGENVGNGALRSRSGLQVSYRKAVEVLAEHFISRGEVYPYVLARNIVKSTLSPRQRQILQAREAKDHAR
jgi:hypothetical protein